MVQEEILGLKHENESFKENQGKLLSERSNNLLATLETNIVKANLKHKQLEENFDKHKALTDAVLNRLESSI